MDGYQSPHAAIEAPQGTAKRPFLVWVVFILYSLGLLAVPVFVGMFLGAIPLPDGPEKTYLNSLGMLEYGVSVGVVLIGWLGAWHLFRMRARALGFFVAELLISCMVLVLSWQNDAYVALMASQETGPAADVLDSLWLTIFCVGYAGYLRKKGRLG